jgi:hypothetical protein
MERIAHRLDGENLKDLWAKVKICPKRKCNLLFRRSRAVEARRKLRSGRVVVVIPEDLMLLRAQVRHH